MCEKFRAADPKDALGLVIVKAAADPNLVGKRVVLLDQSVSICMSSSNPEAKPQPTAGITPGLPENAHEVGGRLERTVGRRLSRNRQGSNPYPMLFENNNTALLQ